MKNYKVIVNVNLEYDFDAKDEDEAIEQVENVELPDSYVSESFEVVKTMRYCPTCDDYRDNDHNHPPKFMTFVR